MNDPGAPTIELRRVGVTYGSVRPVVALRGVDLAVPRGSLTAIMGPSGSGKSTLLNVLGLLERPTVGSYEFLGNAVDFDRPKELALLRRSNIGFVFQSFHLFETKNVIDNVAFGGIYLRIPRRDRYNQAISILSRLGIDHRATAMPNTLSGGEKQRVAIARALMGNRELLLCDEPTGNLDHENSLEVMAILRSISEQGFTVIVVTHDSEVGKACDRICRISDGCLKSPQ